MGTQDGGRQDIELMAHLMRRAGSATQSEIEARVERGYEAAVEDLLDPATRSGWAISSCGASTWKRRG